MLYKQNKLISIRKDTLKIIIIEKTESFLLVKHYSEEKTLEIDIFMQYLKFCI